MDFKKSEKYFLKSLRMMSKLSKNNVNSIFLENQNLNLLYFFSDVEMAKNFADGEIQNIFDLKKEYTQDENYFQWLNDVPQPVWSFYKGTALVL